MSTHTSSQLQHTRTLTWNTLEYEHIFFIKQNTQNTSLLYIVYNIQHTEIAFKDRHTLTHPNWWRLMQIMFVWQNMILWYPASMVKPTGGGWGAGGWGFYLHFSAELFAGLVRNGWEIRVLLTEKIISYSRCTAHAMILQELKLLYLVAKMHQKCTYFNHIVKFKKAFLEWSDLYTGEGLYEHSP